MKNFILKMQSKAAEGSIETAIKVLTAVVLGALIMIGLYAIVNNLVLPTTSTKVNSLFNYSSTYTPGH